MSALVHETMSADAMINDAELSTGLSDWGGDEFRHPFTVLVESAEREADLTEIGRQRLRSWLMLRLEQRLKMVEDRKRRPEIAAQNIEKPVFLFGFPRAGTTFLHTMLSLDPRNVSPAYWQLNLPSPPPNDPTIDHSESTRRMQENLEFQGWTRPEIAAAHFHAADLPEEDFLAFEYSFVSTGFMGFLFVPTYIEQIAAGGDFSQAYKWHRKFLQALQIGAEGRRWMLKAPEHSLHVDTLVAEYPDALLVQHHRDPSKVMASVFSILTEGRRNYCGNVENIGQQEARMFMQMYATGITHAAKARKNEVLNTKFLDMHFRDLERDPVVSVRRVYDHAGISFTREAERQVNEYVSQNRKGKHGKHRYQLSDYGLSQAEVHEAFAEYIDHFGVELETAA
ncbi:sulfotransferase [Novosphingobium sp. G106]|uniref:sulfotransferase family protein n=1 Tax=Novosphingobium sp. G106 TaxID=2849500 RepID=UPI001C2D0467|nr:sulfotransferase [Novosphingobium sp. G106]MBV1688928.1 sulfotransferase [Novosphingobium sp. G106]